MENNKPITVRELKDLLKDFDDDVEIYQSHCQFIHDISAVAGIDEVLQIENKTVILLDYLMDK